MFLYFGWWASCPGDFSRQWPCFSDTRSSGVPQLIHQGDWVENGAGCFELQLQEDWGKSNIIATWVSDNGRFLAYVYGGPDSSNPQDYNHGGFNIYDLEKDEIVYQKSNKEEQVMFSRIGMGNLNYLDIPASKMVSVGIHSPNSDAHKVVFLIDFNNRSIYKTKVDKARYLSLNTKPVDSLLKLLPFTQETF